MRASKPWIRKFWDHFENEISMSKIIGIRKVHSRKHVSRVLLRKGYSGRALRGFLNHWSSIESCVADFRRPRVRLCTKATLGYFLMLVLHQVLMLAAWLRASSITSPIMLFRTDSVFSVGTFPISTTFPVTFLWFLAERMVFYALHTLIKRSWQQDLSFNTPQSYRDKWWRNLKLY